MPWSWLTLRERIICIYIAYRHERGHENHCPLQAILPGKNDRGHQNCSLPVYGESCYDGLVVNIPMVRLTETSVFSTIFVNSSKEILPSRSRSASMIVLSTIYDSEKDKLIGRKTNLLQLLVLQVVSDHHLQHQKQLAIADVSVAINVVDLEGKA